METKKFNIEKFKILSGSALKIIAVISMLIDHIGVALTYEEFANVSFISMFGKDISIYFILRSVGRLAFPVFCFLISEGFYHTKNRFKYGRNLLLFALISEIPFDLFTSRNFFYIGGQNVYFTLFVGFLALYIIDSNFKFIYKALFFAFVIGIFPLLKTDYGLKGVLLIVLFYYLRENNLLKTILSFPFLSGGYRAFCSLAFINLYNGKRGAVNNKFSKYFFYAFYPLHLLILYFVRLYIS